MQSVYGSIILLFEFVNIYFMEKVTRDVRRTKQDVTRQTTELTQRNI
jgi:hypothetical protein